MNHDRPAILGGTPVFSDPIPILRPTLPTLDEMASDLGKILSSGMITNASQVADFEKGAGAFLGVKHCVATNSCTSGLLLSLSALNVRGEVILPSFTFFATAHPVLWNGLTPVFVDCEEDTFNLDPAKVEEAITPHTGAIIAVHMYGNPAEVEVLQEISRRRNIPVIYDAAHAFGSRYKGRSVGGFGSAEVFSLSPTKTVVAGEGGLVATNDDELARLLRAGRNYGDSGNYDPEMIGINARMSEFHATVGIHSLRRVENEVDRRNEIARQYEAQLSNLPGLTFQKVRPLNRSTYKDFSFLVDEQRFGLGRDRLCQALLAENIVTRKYFYPPVHRQKRYSAYYEAQKNDLRNTNRISDSVVSLPIYSSLSTSAVDGICLAIERIKGHAEQVRTFSGGSL